MSGQRRSAGERGSALIYVLIVAGVCVTLGAALAQSAQQSVEAARTRMSALRAFYEAEKGQQLAYNAIAKPGRGLPRHWQFEEGDVHYSYDIVEVGPKKDERYEVTSTGRAGGAGVTVHIVTTVAVRGTKSDPKVEIIAWRSFEGR